MREALRRFLADHVESVRVGDPPGRYDLSRVFEPHAALQADVRPFLVVKEVTTDPVGAWAPFARPYEIWPNVEHESYLDLDALIEEIAAAFETEGWRVPKLAPELGHYHVQEISRGVDAIEDSFGGITKLLRFDVFDLGWLSLETFEPDPVVAMRAWTEATFNDPVPQVFTDPDAWDPSDARPGVYWRFDRILRTVRREVAVEWVEIRIMGHVIAPDYSTRLEWTRRIHHELVRTRRVWLGDDSPLFLEAIGADSTNDPFKNGQIEIRAELGVLVDYPRDGIAVETVTIGGDVSGTIP